MQNYNKALNMINKGNWSAAAKYLKKALSNNPNNAQIAYALGETLLRLNDSDQALVHLQQAISSTDKEPCWHLMHAVALRNKGRYEEAEKAFIAAELSGCTNDNYYYLLGNFHANITKRYDLAEQCFLQLIKQNRSHYHAYVSISALYIYLKRFDEAIEALDVCLSNNFENESVYTNLGIALCNQARQEESLECFKKALKLEPDYPTAKSNYIMQLLHTIDDQQIIHQEVRRISKKTNRKSTLKFKGKVDCSQNRALRLGFVSGDFNSHAISLYITPILENISKKRFSTYLYYNHTIYDESTSRLKSCADHWRDCKLLSDNELESSIKKDKIDILIDLSNHTAHNRLDVFTKKPAPIQIAWMGLPVSTGLDSMDYWLRDSSALATPGIEKCCAEKILPTNDLLWFDHIYDLPDISEPPCLNNGFITFGSLNSLRKLTTTMIDTWAEILHRVPDSKISMLIDDYENKNMQEHIYDIFAAHDVPKNRVLLQVRQSINRFLEAFNKIDIALDPYPYSGQTTTFHSLMMGVPVVTYSGRSLASNFTSSVLSKLKREDWIATNLDDYIDVAVRLANNAEALTSNRTSLRADIMNSSLVDFISTTNNLEDALTSVWNDYCDTHRNPKKGTT